MGFNMLFYIIFGTNLLTGGPVPVSVFCLFQCFAEKEYQTEWNLCDDLSWTESKLEDLEFKSGTPWGSHEVGGRAPISWAPRASTDVLLPPIYVHGPRKHPGAPRNTISTDITFCIHEISSWSLRRRSAGGGIDHGGPLHQHPCSSDELWVVYHRPTGP